MVTSMVLTEGLLSLLRRALILLCSRPGLSVAVAVALPPALLWPEVANAAEIEESKTKIRRSKATKWKLQAMLPQIVRLCVYLGTLTLLRSVDGRTGTSSNSMWLSSSSHDPRSDQWLHRLVVNYNWIRPEATS